MSDSDREDNKSDNNNEVSYYLTLADHLYK